MEEVEEEGEQGEEEETPSAGPEAAAAEEEERREWAALSGARSRFTMAAEEEEGTASGTTMTSFRKGRERKTKNHCENLKEKIELDFSQLACFSLLALLSLFSVGKQSGKNDRRCRP